MLRKLGIIAVLSLIVTAIAVVPALAVSPTTVTSTGGLHVCQGSTLDVSPDTTASGGKILTATGEVCGAGTTATATLSADVSATLGCVTRGGGTPSGLERVRTTAVGSETFQTRSGRGSFDVDTNAIDVNSFTFSCPSRQQTEVLVGPVTFSNIVLTITSQTGTITATGFGDIDP
jgi:hypothetical protein